MGSNSCEDVKVSGSNEAKCSEATVEIKIKTLDSETYTMRVDKCVSVPALKEQIATVTGILSEQQRLICRGKVLKDDQLLSAYHVEDGHTLHLVVRQPIPQSLESVLDHPATDPLSGTGHGQGGPAVVVGTFSMPEQGDGILPDFSRIISAVLGSFGITNVGSDSEPASERLSRPPGRGNSSIFSADWATSSSQSNPYNGALPLHTAAALESRQPLVIPDSLTTLSQYLCRMRQDFSANVRGQSSSYPQTTDTHGSDGQEPDAAASRSTATRGGLPTPGSLAEVMMSTRLILNEQVGECLLQLMRQLEDHANLTDPVARMRTQSNALRSGALLQNLGAFLLELGRTTMTLRMGQTQADAVVNAGPAVFISSSGPTPIMVEPNPFQPGTSFGTVPVGTTQLAPGSSNGTVRSGFFPRNIDIRIHTAIVNQREPTSAPPLVQIDPAVAGDTGNSSRGSVGLFYPVLARGQPGNLNSRRGQESDEHRSPGIDAVQQPTLDSAVQQQSVDVPQVEGATHFGSWIQSELSELDQFLRTVPPIEQIDSSDFSTNSATGHVRPTRDDSSSQEAAPIVGDEGTLLSNLLRQIMPVLSENTNGLNNSVAEAQLDRNRGSTSHRRGSPPPPSSSKRQKRE